MLIIPHNQVQIQLLSIQKMYVNYVIDFLELILRENQMFKWCQFKNLKTSHKSSLI